jgi:thioredoxin-related protein
MKKIIVLIALEATLMAGELTNSMLEAKRQGIPLMIMVASETCTYCDKMTNITLKDATVKESIKDFMFIKVEQTDKDVQRFLGKHMKYPPTIFFLSKYKILNKAEGYLSPSNFIPWVEDTKRKLGMKSSVSQVTNSYQNSSSSSIDWMYDIPSAVDYAAQTSKQIMIFVNSSNSKWSRELESKTLESSRVQNALNDFVLVKVQKGDAGLSSYGLNPTHVPTVYFMTSGMRTLVTAKGFFGANDFLKYVNYAKSKM